MFHPSSIEETFLELVSWQCNADITLSGHMGHMDGSKAFTDHNKLPKLQDCYQQLLLMYPSYKKELEIFRPQEKNWIIEHVNLPDSKDGYGLLEINNSNFNIQIYGRSYHSKLKDTLGDNLYEEIIESKNIEGKNLSIFSAKIQKIITKEINDKETISAILNQLLTFSHIWSFQKLFFNCCEAIIEDYPKLVNKLYDIVKNVYGITSTENW